MFFPKIQEARRSLLSIHVLPIHEEVGISVHRPRLEATDKIAGAQKAVLLEDADGGLGAAATLAKGATAYRVATPRLVQSGPEQWQLLLKARESSR